MSVILVGPLFSFRCHALVSRVGSARRTHSSLLKSAWNLKKGALYGFQPQVMKRFLETSWFMSCLLGSPRTHRQSPRTWTGKEFSWIPTQSAYTLWGHIANWSLSYWCNKFLPLPSLLLFVKSSSIKSQVTVKMSNIRELGNHIISCMIIIMNSLNFLGATCFYLRSSTSNL